MSFVGTDATPLDPEDARILALESGPIRGHTLKILVVEDAPGPSAVSELRASIEAKLADEPRWRQRLVPAPGTSTGLSWQDDPEFRIEEHVRAIQTTEQAGESLLRRAIAETMMAPLDRDQPLWRLDVVSRLAGGRWALIWKVHHCLADGASSVRVGSRLVWAQDKAPVDRAAEAAGSGRAATPRQPKANSRLRSVAGYRAVLLREFRRTASLSPLAAKVGERRDIAFARCSLDELHALGRSVAPHVTINDVLLAVVAGALRHWLFHRGSRPASMKVEVPVSMHSDAQGDQTAGNRDSYLLVRLPVSEADPVARVRTVNSAMRLRKNRHDARAIYDLRQTVSHLPGPVRRAIQHWVEGPHEYSLNVSNVPGPATPIRVLDRRVHELYSIAEVAPRHALRISAVSLDGQLFIGLCADPDAVPDLDVIAAGIALSVTELRERLAI